ncbi:MAG TPA: tetratricopeptide repeat protein [Hyphomicrobiaceae bacterium]|nr:tetratricopeptide repeat protein [Hyphomicrobiaceae bacterium]
MTLLVAACSQSRGDVGAPGLSGEAGQHVAQAAEESGDVELAGQIYAEAAAANPSDAAAQLRYADVLARGGDIAAAGDLLKSRLATVSDPLLLRDGLGSIYVVSGEPTLAVTEYDAVLAAKPNDMRALVNKGVALDLLGRHGDAQALYQKALAFAPGDATILNDMALSMLLAGHPRDAEQVVAPLRSQPDVAPRIRAGVGVVLAANGDVDGARQMAGSQATEAQLLALANAAVAMH